MDSGMEVKSSQKLSLTAVLPAELLTCCLEFSRFDKVHANAKQISKALRSAARRALTRGSWRPVKLFAEHGLVDSASGHEQIRAAWAIEPGDVMFRVGGYYSGLSGCPPPPQKVAGHLMQLVEPSIDGLARIISASERFDKFNANDMFCGFIMLVKWAESLGHHLRLGYPHPPPYGSCVLDSNTENRLFGLGLESWTDPKRAAVFVNLVLDETGYFTQIYNPGRNYFLGAPGEVQPKYRQMHERWSRDWRDRSRAAAFVAEGVRLLEESEREMQADNKRMHCPHGEYRWDCPHCSGSGDESEEGDDDIETEEEE